MESDCNKENWHGAHHLAGVHRARRCARDRIVGRLRPTGASPAAGHSDLAVHAEVWESENFPGASPGIRWWPRVYRLWLISSFSSLDQPYSIPMPVCLRFRSPGTQSCIKIRKSKGKVALRLDSKEWIQKTGKHTRKPFLKCSLYKAEKPLQLVSSDLCGPILPETPGDRGGEFTSFEFNEFCKKEGVERQLTAPYSPQRNGVNTKALNKKTPYEALKERKPDLKDGMSSSSSIWVEFIVQDEHQGVGEAASGVGEITADQVDHVDLP
ncbi:hypothetical protein E3N88_28894 [Mikania micrantha]|uniref:Integrase catalytic domain-containing protein n=1 Tax=Mikania micrantha TaxID=192012 RepID=A0A5N6N0S2_9ASTR|nr:hypothetical protein E3N88_28894 [Mikania micrantha]